MRLGSAAVLAGLAFGLISSTVSASEMTLTYSFRASDFPQGAPFTTLYGSFTETFDPTVAQSAEPLLTFTSNLPADYLPVSFINNVAFGESFVIVGDACSNFSCGTVSNTNEFFLQFTVDANGQPNGNVYPAYQNMNISVASQNASYFPSSFVVQEGLSAVPLPPSAPMFGAALLALGTVGYGLKRKRAAAA